MFGNKLKELRKFNNISQRELAQKLKLSKSTISMYECGNRIPALETLEEIADFFNIDIDTLVGKSDKTTLLLSMKEKAVIDAYRCHEDLQPIIDKILDIKKDSDE